MGTSSEAPKGKAWKSHLWLFGIMLQLIILWVNPVFRLMLTTALICVGILAVVIVNYVVMCYLSMKVTKKVIIQVVLVLSVSSTHLIKGSDLKAKVSCLDWKVPGNIVKQTSVYKTDARDWSCMYMIDLWTNSKDGSASSELSVPNACYISVRKNGQEEGSYPDVNSVPLPDISREDKLEVTAWSKNEASRPNAGKVDIKFKGGWPLKYKIKHPTGCVAQFIDANPLPTIGAIFIALILWIFLHCRLRQKMGLCKELNTKE